MSFPRKIKIFLILFFFVLAITCIHIGFSEYLSVQFISIFLIAVWLLFFKHAFVKENFYIKFLVLTVFWISITLIKGNVWELLVVLRILFIIFFLGMVLSLARSPSNNYSTVITAAVKFAGIFTLCLSIIQLVEINFLRTSYFFLDSKFYALSYGTTDKDIVSSAARAKALFSEPSTLGAWGFIIAVIGRIKGSSSLMLLGLMNCLFSYSLAGILCLFIYFSLVEFKRFISFRKSGSWYGLFLLLVLISVGYFIFRERILFIFSGGELSTIIRVIAPVTLIQDSFFSGDFFGQSKTFLNDKAYLKFGIEHVFDNFILNIIMLNGVFGFVIIFGIYKLFDKQLALVILLISTVNGDPFYWDRALFLFVLIVSTRGISAIQKTNSKIISASNERHI